MQITTAGIWRASATLLLAGSLAACTVDKQEAPALIGPAGSAQSLTLSASPDRLTHNGIAQSVVTVTMRDDVGQPISSQRVGVAASTGTISNVDVITGADGRATFIVTAPALSTPADKISVFATPFGTNADTALTRTLSIALTGTLNATSPTASFTVAPDTLAPGEFAVFDASATTDEGNVCGSLCTYSWSFGDGGNASGPVVSHRFAAAGTYVVALTVVDNAGTADSKSVAVTVEP